MHFRACVRSGHGRYMGALIFFFLRGEVWVDILACTVQPPWWEDYWQSHHGDQICVDWCSNLNFPPASFPQWITCETSTTVGLPLKSVNAVISPCAIVFVRLQVLILTTVRLSVRAPRSQKWVNEFCHVDWPPHTSWPKEKQEWPNYHLKASHYNIFTLPNRWITWPSLRSRCLSTCLFDVMAKQWLMFESPHIRQGDLNFRFKDVSKRDGTMVLEYQAKTLERLCVVCAWAGHSDLEHKQQPVRGKATSPQKHLPFCKGWGQLHPPSAGSCRKNPPPR